MRALEMFRGFVTPPRYLTTAEAAIYCRFKGASSIRKAHHEGKIFPVGRRGGRGTCMWSVEDLDRYLRGEAPDAGARALLATTTTDLLASYAKAVASSSERIPYSEAIDAGVVERLKLLARTAQDAAAHV